MIPSALCRPFHVFVLRCVFANCTGVAYLGHLGLFHIDRQVVGTIASIIFCILLWCPTGAVGAKVGVRLPSFLVPQVRAVTLARFRTFTCYTVGEKSR